MSRRPMPKLAMGAAAVTRRMLLGGEPGSRGAKAMTPPTGSRSTARRLKAGVERGDGARELAHEHGKAEREPEPDAAAHVVQEDGGVCDGGGEQKQERDVHAHFNAEESAEGD